MCPEDTVRIPLRARNGVILAHTLVDAADADFVNQWQWRLHQHGYAYRSVGARSQWRIFLHRVLLGLSTWDPREGDHIDRDRLNNCRSNLRAIPLKGNRQNRSSTPGSSSSFRGVHWVKQYQKWRAMVKVDGVSHYLGRFDTEIEAAEAAAAARLRLMPYAVD